MSIYAKLIAALERATGYPVVPDLYTGDADKWLVFSLALEEPAIFGDNEEAATRQMLQVSYYCPRSHNYLADKKAIRTAIKSIADKSTIIGGITTQSWLEERGITGTEYIRHTVFEFEAVTKETEE